MLQVPYGIVFFFNFEVISFSGNVVTWHFSIDNVVNCGYLFSMSKYDSFHRLPPWILCFFSFRVQMGWYSYLTMQNLETLKGIASWCHILEFGLTMYLFLPQLGIFSGTSCLSPSANPDDIITRVVGIDVFLCGTYAIRSHSWKPLRFLHPTGTYYF